jgi:copper homeostasis protein
MVRPREGDFLYSASEFAAMRASVADAAANGAAGVVFGILRVDDTLDVARMSELTTLARPMRVACHRAFDRTPVPDEALDVLLALGVDLVLTSGHAPTALDGAPVLARHVRRAGERMVILAGGSVRAGNVRDIVERTGVREVHARATDPRVFKDVVRAARAGT